MKYFFSFLCFFIPTLFNIFPYTGEIAVTSCYGQTTRDWATYYGGTGLEYGYSVVTDASGNVYMAGQTDSPSGIMLREVLLIDFNKCNRIFF